MYAKALKCTAVAIQPRLICKKPMDKKAVIGINAICQPEKEKSSGRKGSTNPMQTKASRICQHLRV